MPAKISSYTVHYRTALNFAPLKMYGGLQHDTLGHIRTVNMHVQMRHLRIVTCQVLLWDKYIILLSTGKHHLSGAALSLVTILAT